MWSVTHQRIAWAPTRNLLTSAVWVEQGSKVGLIEHKNLLADRLDVLLTRAGKEAWPLVEQYLEEAPEPLNGMALVELLESLGMVTLLMETRTAERESPRARILLNREEQEPALEALERYLSEAISMN